MSGVFVNPYTFVPFIEPGAGFRGKPAGHDALAEGRYLGEITVRMTARSPLLLRGVSAADEGFPRRDGAPFIPGSSLAGVVRSLHELIAGGCLRVFDEKFTPGYRDLASMRDDRWRLVRVDETDESGQPTSMTVCARDPVWVTAKALAQVLGGAPNVVTGATVEVTGSDRKEFGSRRGQQMSRLEAVRGPDDDDPQVRSGDGWVILVTDSGARHPTGRGDDRRYKSFYCATGQLTGQAAKCSDEAWQNYLISVADTDDVRRARTRNTLRPPAPVLADVNHTYDNRGAALVGRRHEARPKLFEGQVLWARLSKDRTVVEELALAAIWRHPGKHPAGKRVPEGLLPCREVEELCPTCRIFGSADTEGGDDTARQRSYRGHVRFGDALPVGEIATHTYNLAPLGAPRPGAGQFYLSSAKSGAAPGTPLREWGSPAADKNPENPRRLNGRKQYWLTGRHEQRPFFRTAGPFAGEMASTAEAVQAGATFGFTVRFDGLTEAEIGGLLTALSPRLGLPGKGTLGIAVGGGRPLGFGTCVTEITGLTVQNARSRYLGEDPPRLDIQRAVTAFGDTAAKQVRDTWPLVAKALRLDVVDPADVWYPPAEEVGEGSLLPEDLEPGFEFWQQSRGLKHQSADRGDDQLRQLPRLEESSQELPVRDRRDRGKPW